MLRVPQSHFLGPNDLALCQSVFDQVCADAKLSLGSVDRQVLALTVLAFFQHGSLIGMSCWARWSGVTSPPCLG